MLQGIKSVPWFRFEHLDTRSQRLIRMSGSGVEFEKLVQLVEQSINPNAKVEHDVQMPIANSPTGATTQCDVVITTGTPPRETVTIVEVQDRGSKPAANDFRGWQQKLREVNAQHLICVSRTGFTESEIEKASQSGNRIRLVTLSELDADQIPLNFFEMYFVYDSEDGYIGFEMPVTEIADDDGYEIKGLRIEDPEEQLFEFTLYRNRRR